MEFKEKCRSALYASIIGDSLAVPLEHKPIHDYSLSSVKEMLGIGRFNQPKGTWSDDTSLMLASMHSLIHGYDIEDIGNNFCKWLYEGKWTPAGHAVDAGLTTVTALERIKTKQKSAKNSGGKSEDDNGNGALMRILPAAIYFSHLSLDRFLQTIHAITAITHAHNRSKIGCGIYSLIIKNILTSNSDSDKQDIFIATAAQAKKYYCSKRTFSPEAENYERILNADILTLEEEEIDSSGYIIDTLETSLWCFLHFNNTKDILLQSVNLGLGTDTAGTAAGGIAGVFYGLDLVPSEWIHSLIQKEMIDSIIDQFVTTVASKS